MRMEVAGSNLLLSVFVWSKPSDFFEIPNAVKTKIKEKAEIALDGELY